MNTHHSTQKLLRSGLEQSLQAYDGSKVKKFHSLASGWESSIYGFNKVNKDHSEALVMRYYSPGMTEQTTRREWDVITYLKKQNYPVPYLIGNPPEERLEGSLYLLMQHINGYPMWSRLKTPDDYSIGLAKLAGLMVALHRQEPDTLAQTWRLPLTGKAAILMLFQEWQQFIQTGNALSDAFRPVMMWFVNEIEHIHEVPCSILHGDMHPANILVETRTDDLYVIDWTGAAINDPRLDVFWAALLVGSQAEEPYFDVMVDAYQQASGIVLEDQAYFTALVCFRRLASLLISAVMGAEHLGMRSEIGVNISRQVPMMRRIYRRFITATDGMCIPFVESYLSQFSD